MKLISLETFVVGNPNPAKGGRYFVFVKLVSKCGIVGYGEIYAPSFSPFVVEKMAIDLFSRYFEGQDPHQIEKFFRLCYSSGFSQRPDVSLLSVFSGLEMACWDIIGKAAGRPVYDLLGGRAHERLRAYTYIYPADDDLYPQDGGMSRTYTDPDLAAERALVYVNQGFTAVKFDPAGPYTVYDGHQPDLSSISRSVDFCCKIRAAVGDKADLLFGTHGQFTPSGAKRLAKQLEVFDPLWFEEPVPPDAPEAMADVAKFTSIPIATGERLCSKYEFAKVLQTGAASILQMNLGRVGGLLEAKKIAGMAETCHALIAPHLYCGPLVGAANVQLATCTPNFLVLESIEDWGGFHGEILRNKMPFEAGYVIPPTEPGLGVELNEDVARAHPYKGTLLHLEMSSDVPKPGY